MENSRIFGPCKSGFRNPKKSTIKLSDMKRIAIALLALVSAGTIMAQTTTTTTTTTTTPPQKKFADVATVSPETFDFGKIKQNVPAVATFTITNISKEPIVIEQA